MNRLKEEWHVGQLVWARYRSSWRSGVIVSIGRKWIALFFSARFFDDHGTTILDAADYTKRLPEDLRLRDKTLTGADRPSLGLDRPLRGKRMGEEATEASGGVVAARGEEAAALLAYANREMFGDEVAELMALGILPDDIGAK